MRTVALTLDRLEEAEAQLELWGMVMAGGAETGTGNELPGAESGSGLGAGFPARSRPRALQQALDRITTRYGARAVASAAVHALTR